jgi:hypothetical protein
MMESSEECEVGQAPEKEDSLAVVDRESEAFSSNTKVRFQRRTKSPE